MHDFQKQCQVISILVREIINCVLCDSEFVVIFFRTMHNKTFIRFGFCDIRNNQGLGECHQPQSSASADNTYLDLDYSEYNKNRI